jgi:vesicle transport protein SEC22
LNRGNSVYSTWTRYIYSISQKNNQLLFSYIIKDDVCFLCICDRSYPRKLAFTYLADLATEFTTTYSTSQYHSPNLRPYAFVEFDTFIQRTKGTYQNSRAAANLDKLNDELRDVTKVMTKNIEDLLYRGDSLERMGEMSGRLREDSLKYRKAAVRINWELLLKQVSSCICMPCVSEEKLTGSSTARSLESDSLCSF